MKQPSGAKIQEVNFSCLSLKEYISTLDVGMEYACCVNGNDDLNELSHDVTCLLLTDVVANSVVMEVNVRGWGLIGDQDVDVRRQEDVEQLKDAGDVAHFVHHGHFHGKPPPIFLYRTHGIDEFNSNRKTVNGCRDTE